MTLEQQFAPTKPGDYGIFGDPIEHSLSPAMQNAALEAWWGETKRPANKRPIYHKFQVKKGELREAFSLAAKYGLAGFNVTVPHKEAAAEIVPLLDDFAQELKSVNTVALNEVGVKGYNTDGFGFETSLRENLHFQPRGKSALILGAGGTGRMVVRQLGLLGIKNVFLWNRTFERAEALLKDLGAGWKVVLVQTKSEMKQALSASDLVVNTTSVGLKPSDGLPAPDIAFSSSQAYFDVIYHRETAFLNEAKKAGAKAVSGLGMLLYQGARAFEIWTKSPAPIKIMKKKLNEAL